MSASGGQGLDWGVERLHLQLSQVMPNLAVEVVSKIASTNTALLERACGRAGPPLPAAALLALRAPRFPSPVGARRHAA